MDGEQGCSRPGGGADGSGYGVGDVVELEVEEDVEAAVAEVFDEAVAGGVVELHADFEPLAGVAETVYEIERLTGVGEVEGHGEAVFWVELGWFCGWGLHFLSLEKIRRWCSG